MFLIHPSDFELNEKEIMLNYDELPNTTPMSKFRIVNITLILYNLLPLLMKDEFLLCS